MNEPRFDENSCLYQSHGFQLFAHNGTPWVIHRYSKRLKDANGAPMVENYIEHFLLESEGWPQTATAQAVRVDMKAAWKERIDWDAAMKASKEKA